VPGSVEVPDSVEVPGSAGVAGGFVGGAGEAEIEASGGAFAGLGAGFAVSIPNASRKSAIASSSAAEISFESAPVSPSCYRMSGFSVSRKR
jgi:hypothetical protein